jgi:Leucine-rich repeat (LRR) protein
MFCDPTRKKPHITVNLSNKGLQPKDLKEKLIQYAEVAHLDLSKNYVGSDGVQVLSQLPNLSRCVSLNLLHNSICAGGARAIAKMTNLVSLNLKGNHICDDGIRALSSLSNLTDLNLENNNIYAKGMEGLRYLTALKYLNLAGNNADIIVLVLNQPGNNANTVGTAVLTHLQALTELDLSRNRVEDATDFLLHLTALTSLNLRSNHTHNVGIQPLAQLTNLTSLDLSDNPISELGVEVLRHLTRLVALRLCENHVGPPAAAAIALLSNLTSLHMWDNALGDDGVRMLTTLVNLTDLDLSRNDIGSIGVQALSGLTALTRLGLWNNHIADVGAQFLSQYPARLRSLDVCMNNIRLVGAQYLTQLTSLTALSIDDNDLENPGVQVLAQLPNLSDLSILDTNSGILGTQAFLAHTQLRRIGVSLPPSEKASLHALDAHIANNNANLKRARYHLLEILIIFVHTRLETDTNCWASLPPDLVLVILSKFTSDVTFRYWGITQQQLLTTYQAIRQYYQASVSPVLPYPYFRVARVLNGIPETLNALTQEQACDEMQTHPITQHGFFMPATRQDAETSESDSRLSAKINSLRLASAEYVRHHHVHLQTPAKSIDHCATYLRGCDEMKQQLAVVLAEVQALSINDSRVAQLKILHDKLTMFSIALRDTEEGQYLSTQAVYNKRPRLTP